MKLRCTQTVMMATQVRPHPPLKVLEKAFTKDQVYPVKVSESGQKVTAVNNRKEEHVLAFNVCGYEHDEWLWNYFEVIPAGD